MYQKCSNKLNYISNIGKICIKYNITFMYRTRKIFLIKEALKPIMFQLNSQIKQNTKLYTPWYLTIFSRLCIVKKYFLL